MPHYLLFIYAYWFMLWHPALLLVPIPSLPKRTVASQRNRHSRWRGSIPTDELINVGAWEVAGEGRLFNSRVGRVGSLGVNGVDPKAIEMAWSYLGPQIPRKNENGILE